VKKYLLLSCLFLIINRGVAQDFGAQLLFGTNFSQVDGDQLGGYHKLGLNTGIQINRNIHENWVSAFEIRYSMKGAKKIIDPEAPPTFTLDLKYHYLEVPFLIKYTGWQTISPYLGISMGINILNERDENGIITKESELRKSEVGFHLGGTYPLNNRWHIDLRHSYSLLSIRDYPIEINSPVLFQRIGWFNRLITVGLIYQLSN